MKDGILPKFRHPLAAWLRTENEWKTTSECYAWLKARFMRGPSMSQMSSMLAQSKEFRQRKINKCSEWRI